MGFSIIPNPSPREGSVDGWGKYGLRSSLLAFKTKWRKKGQKQVSPRQRLGDSSQSTFAQNGQKNYYSAHSLCHSAVGGCYSFAPPSGAYPCCILSPRALPGAGISMPLRGVGSLTFRRICYPPESNIRIFNPQYPATQPRLKSADKYK